MTRIFAGNDIDILECFYSTKSNIAKIADWRTYNIQR